MQRVLLVAPSIAARTCMHGVLRCRRALQQQASVRADIASGQSADPRWDLGRLLTGFLTFFGGAGASDCGSGFIAARFDPTAHAVSIRQGGIVAKERVALKQKKAQPLVVEDPQARSLRSALHSLFRIPCTLHCTAFLHRAGASLAATHSIR